MSPSSGQTIAARIAPKTIDTMQMLAERTGYTPSRLALIMIDEVLPSMEKVTASYESGLLSVARWIDKLLSWMNKTALKASAAGKTKTGAKQNIRGQAKETFSIWLPNETLEKIDIIAKRFYMSRGRLVGLVLDSCFNKYSVDTGVTLANFHDFLAKTGHELNIEFEGTATKGNNE